MVFFCIRPSDRRQNERLTTFPFNPDFYHLPQAPSLKSSGISNAIGFFMRTMTQSFDAFVWTEELPTILKSKSNSHRPTTYTSYVS